LLNETLLVELTLLHVCDFRGVLPILILIQNAECCLRILKVIPIPRSRFRFIVNCRSVGLRITLLEGSKVSEGPAQVGHALCLI
jgi:hypothetical protein